MLEGKKVEIKTADSFAPLPADKYTVQIVDVNLVTQQKYQSVEEEEVLNYQFQILDDNPMEGDDEEEETTRGRFLWKRCRLSINNRSHLGKLAAAVIGRPLTKEECAEFDPEAIVGKQVNVMVDQTPSNKDPEIIYNNIISFNKVVKELEPLETIERDTAPVQKTTKTVAQKAPDSEADEFLESLKEDTSVEEEEDPEVLELQLKLAKAKAKKK